MHDGTKYTRRCKSAHSLPPVVEQGAQAPTICIATIMRPSGDTGVQTHVNSFLSFLRRRGHEAVFVTPFSAPSALVYPVFALRRLVDPVNGPLSVWWYRHWHGHFLRIALTRALAREKGAVVIYAQCPVSAAAALRARHNPEQQIVMVVHFNVSQADEWVGKGRVRPGSRSYRSIQRFEERTLPQLDGVVYVSQFIRELLEARIPALRRIRASVIPNFLELPPVKQDAGIRGDLVTIGTLEPRKNQAYLLAILSAAARKGHHYTLTLIGDGPDRAGLEQLARRLGIESKVRMLGFRSDVSTLVASHRLYCHVARQESFGLAIAEAMACGTPVAACPVGGVPEVFRSEIDGFFWPLDSPERAARILIDHMTDEPHLAQMGAAGRERVIECFLTDVVAPRLLAFLHDRSESRSL